MQKKKPNWKLFIKITGTIITISLFIWLLSKMDWQKALVIIREMPPYSYIFAILLLLAGQFVNSIRWFILLRAQNVNINITKTFKIFLSGAFASNFLPSTIGGDSFRFLALSQVTGDQSLSLASIILDRLINVLATSTFIPFGIIILKKAGYTPTFFQKELAILATKSGKIQNWIKRITKKYFDLIKRWLQKPKFLVTAFLVAWLSTFILFSAIWVLSDGIGIQLTLWEVIGVSAVSYFVTLIPISISGYGLRELTITTLYTLLGASLEQATALALISRIFSVMVTLPGSIWLQQLVPNKKEKE